MTGRLPMAVLTAATLLFTACSSLSVQTDHDPSADFSTYATYQWLEKEDISALENTPTGRMMKDIIDEELRGKGLRPADGDPDVFAVFHAGIDEVVTGATIDSWGYGHGRYYGGWGSSSVTVQSYQQGTLIVDLIDAGRNELVWRGVATDAVNSGDSQEKRREKLGNVVQKMLADYPPN